MGSRPLIGLLLFAVATLSAIAIYPIPLHVGSWSLMVRLPLYLAFGVMSYLVPMLIAFDGVLCFCRFNRETTLALAYIGFGYFMVGDVWVGAGEIGQDIAYLMNRHLQQLDKPILIFLYATLAVVLFGVKPGAIVRVARSVGKYRVSPMRLK